MRTLASLVLALSFVAAGCEREKLAAGPGPVDPIPGPAGAVAPGGNNVPAIAGRQPPVAPSGSGGAAASAAQPAEASMPPQGSGTGRSVQDSSAHGATRSREQAGQGD